MLSIGDDAPAFRLVDDRGEVVSLADILARGRLILFFYPADFTPVCTSEACRFRIAQPKLRELGIELWGVNAHSVDSHRRFRERHSLPFGLLSDPDKSVARAYGAVGGFGLFVRRVTYFIDRDGRILGRVSATWSARRHEEFVNSIIERA